MTGGGGRKAGEGTGGRLGAAWHLALPHGAGNAGARTPGQVLGLEQLVPLALVHGGTPTQDVHLGRQAGGQPPAPSPPPLPTPPHPSPPRGSQGPGAPPHGSAGGSPPPASRSVPSEAQDSGDTGGPCVQHAG